MTEQELQRMESAIAEASAKEVAAVAFAAICRIGEIGRDAGDAFRVLASGAGDDPDISTHWIEGCGQIEDHLAF